MFSLILILNDKKIRSILHEKKLNDLRREFSPHWIANIEFDILFVIELNNLQGGYPLIFQIGSTYGIYLSYKHNKTTIEFDFYKQKIQQVEQSKQNYYTKNISRVNLMPHFHLLLDKEIEIKTRGDSNEEILVLSISLINVGKENATNIRLVPMLEDEIETYYFKTGNLDGEVHRIRDYIDKQYAIIGEAINFTTSCKKHDKPLNVFFEIRFNDIAGRTYEQDFHF